MSSTINSNINITSPSGNGTGQTTSNSTLRSIRSVADALLELEDSQIDYLSEKNGYYFKCAEAASYLKNPLPSMGYSLSAVNALKNAVNDVVTETTRFIQRARSAGFDPPKNPFLEIFRLNSERKIKIKSFRELDITETQADDLAFSIDILLKLIAAEKNGELSLERSTENSAQISSFFISLDGFRFSSNSNIDLLSFIPDVDAIKRKRIEESLNSLSFNKRVPKLLFTSNFDPDDISKGIVVGWRKMPDASGYIIERTSLFTSETKTFNFSNDEINSEYSLISNYVKDWVLSFYDKSIENSVLAFVDKTAESNNIYKYKIKGYQIARSDKNTIFDVDLTKCILSNKQLQEIEDSMKLAIYGTKRISEVEKENNDGDKNFVVLGTNSLTPYPFLSQKLYTTDKLDWIISAINVKAAIKRGENRANVRKYSYLGSTFLFIKSKLEDYKVFLPANIDDVIRNVNSSISSFGVSQTLLDIFEATGLIYFMSNKEDTDDDATASFSRPDQVFDDTDVTLVSDILASVDPETATVNVNYLLNNLSKSQFITKTSELTTTPSELTVNSEFAEDPFQFTQSVETNFEILDLTTFDGISEFIRIIRAFFDKVPDRKK